MSKFKGSKIEGDIIIESLTWFVIQKALAKFVLATRMYRLFWVDRIEYKTLGRK